jgi:succinate-semialdehyde dehydrogenase / glutarate-semialdehyde dehydrogenase
MLQSINPTTEELLDQFSEHEPATIERAFNASERTFGSWRTVSLRQRGDLLHSVAKELRRGGQTYAGLITTEMGKPIVEAEAEIEKCAWCCDYFADHAEEFLADRPTASAATESMVHFEPLGSVLAVMPWNFPFWQVFRFAAPTLMAGNTALLKHSANVPQCALAIERVFREAGAPDALFQTLLLSSENVGGVIDDDRVRAVTLTGSDIAGSKVAERSGKALKKTVLELGGSDPFIILPDADLGAAVATAVNSRYQNTGQSCIAAKRFIVLDEIMDEFVPRFVAAVGELQTGDPMDRETRVGPLARGDLRSGLHDQVERSVAQEAVLATGGHPLDRKGYFYQPTVLTDVRPGMPAFDEETFGPVAGVIRARDVSDAIELANRSRYGLAATIWTQDVAQARTLAHQIEAGSVFINGLVASDPRLPFGGIKRSGYGRELSEFGIHEFVNIQTIWIGPRQDEQPRSE